MSPRKRSELTARDFQILDALAYQDRPVPPMEIGATDASWHSYTLQRLRKRELVVREPRLTLMNSIRGPGGRPTSYNYAITDLGREALAHHSAPPRKRP